MRKRWLSLALCGAMMVNLFAPMTVQASGNIDIGGDLEVEEGVEEWEDGDISGDEDTTCKEHSWGDWMTVIEPTCTQDGSEERSCEKCGEKATRTVEANGHSWNANYTVDVEATCTTDGSKSIHCSVIGCLETKDSQVIPKLGHEFKTYESNDDATCIADGTKTAKCERCTVTKTVIDEGSKKAHTYGNEWVKDADYHWNECSACGEKNGIAAHNYQGDICSVCGYERAHVHQTKMVNAVDATCTESGSKAYYTCSGCGNIFEDTEGKNVISDRTTLMIDVLGHEFKDYKSNNDATCTADGTKTSKCSRCDVKDTIADEGSAKGHDMTKVPYAAPTCDKSGNAEYYTCSACKNWFEDVAGKKLISDKNKVVIGATGHAYADFWSKGGDSHWHECAKCYAKKDKAAHSYEGDTCSVCGYKKAHEHSLTIVKAIDATCISEGRKAYYTCSGCDSIFEDAKGKNEITDRNTLVIEALGHTFKDYTSNGDATCTVDGTKTAKCIRCTVTDTVKDTGSAKGHKASDAWNMDDTMHWEVCGACEVKMNQASHTFINDTCYVCGYERAHVHKLSVVKAVDATCEKDGRLAYYKCSGCNSIFEDAEGEKVISDKNSLVVKAFGHKFTDYKSDGNATCTADGTKTAKCDRCTKKDTVKDEGSATGHSYSSFWKKDSETHWHECSACGEKADKASHTYEADSCSVCGYEKAHVHTLTKVEAIEAACEAEGRIAYYTCSGCDGWFVDAAGLVLIPDKRLVIVEALGHNYDSKGICGRCGQKDPNMPEIMESAITFANLERTVTYTGEVVELSRDDVSVTAGDGEVVFTYYVDEACQVPTFADEESVEAGSAPVSPGRYYVKASILATDTHEEAATEDTFLLIIRPRKVTGAKAVNNKSSIKLTWKKSNEADGYIIYRRKKGTSVNAFKAIKTIKNNATVSYYDYNIKQGNAYIYNIRAYVDAKDGTRVKSFLMNTGAKIVRAKVTSIENQNGAVKIKWTKLSGVAGYKVYRKSSVDNSYKLIKTIKKAGINYYVDKGVKAIKNGKASYYYVKPYYEKANGYVLTTDKKVNYYVSRTAITSVSGAKKAFTVKWKKNSKANGYQICYSRNKSFVTYRTVTVNNKNTVSRKVKNLVGKKTYYVKVRTYKSYNGVKYYSAWSTVKTVKSK